LLDFTPPLLVRSEGITYRLQILHGGSATAAPVLLR